MMTFSEVIVSSSEKKYIFYISSISIAVNNWHMCPDEGKLGAICFRRPRRWNNFARDVTREIFSSRAHTLTQEQNMIHVHEKRYYVDLVLNRRNNNIRRKMTQQVCKILFLQSKLSGLKAPGFILPNWFFTRGLWQHHNWTFPEGDISRRKSNNVHCQFVTNSIWCGGLNTFQKKQPFCWSCRFRTPDRFPFMKKGRFCLLWPLQPPPICVFCQKPKKLRTNRPLKAGRGDTSLKKWM